MATSTTPALSYADRLMIQGIYQVQNATRIAMEKFSHVAHWSSGDAVSYVRGTGMHSVRTAMEIQRRVRSRVTCKIP